MIIVVMGPQACGKGTQGRLLSEALKIPLVTNGEILRSLPENHPQKKLVSSQMNKGELVDQKFMAQLIKDRIAQPDCANGYILDGWMRKDIDLDYFYPPLDYIINITLPREESVRRISGRRVCALDGKTVNVLTQSSEEFEYCEGQLMQRPDDNEAAVNRRLNIFYTDTMHVIDEFRSKDKVIEVSGLGSPEEVFTRIKAELIKRGIPLQ